jgi:hypothetical protein
MRLEPGLATAFARVAIANVSRPYPHKLDHLLTGPEPLAADHVARHPVFCGAYDWHSAVHMHWLLARVLRMFPDGGAADEIRDAQPAFEPSLTDFLSPILCEAALMATVRPADSFTAWFDGFLPEGIGPLAEPPLVGDRGDPQIAHLDGLCLSRAWCLRRIAAGLGAGESMRLAELWAAAEANFEPALPHTVGGDYVGEHWLASFAALALGDVP